MSGSSRKGNAVQRDEWRRMLDGTARPLHGKSQEEMNTARRRVYLPQSDQRQCARLDDMISRLGSEAGAAGADKARADVDLYKARKQYFDLKC